MATINYLYPVYTTVYHLDEQYGVREAVVYKVDLIVQNHETTLKYGIQYTKSPGTNNQVDETTLYADLSSALAAYALLIPAA